MRALESLTGLTRLGLKERYVINEQLSIISDLRHMHALDISDTKVMDAGKPTYSFSFNQNMLFMRNLMVEVFIKTAALAYRKKGTVFGKPKPGLPVTSAPKVNEAPFPLQPSLSPYKPSAYGICNCASRRKGLKNAGRHVNECVTLNLTGMTALARLLLSRDNDNGSCFTSEGIHLHLLAMKHCLAEIHIQAPIENALFEF